MEQEIVQTASVDGQILPRERSFDLETFLRIFFIASMVGLGLWIIVGIVLGCVQKAVDYVFSGFIPFSDFAETLSYAICPNPYTGEYGIRTIYPPLSFLIFYPFTWICRGALDRYVAKEITLEQLSADEAIIVR